MASGGESDTRNYYDMIAARQEPERLDRTKGYVPSDNQETGDALTWLPLLSSNAGDGEVM